MPRLLAVVPQQPQQRCHPVRRFARREDDAAPLFEPMHRVRAIRNPSVDVCQRDGKQRRIGLDFIRDGAEAVERSLVGKLEFHARRLRPVRMENNRPRLIPMASLSAVCSAG